MSSCRIITSPVTKKRVGSKTWDSIHKSMNKNTVEGLGPSILVRKDTSDNIDDFKHIMLGPTSLSKEKQADALYGQLTTPEFKGWFGDWVHAPGDKSVSDQVNDIGEPLIYSRDDKTDPQIRLKYFQNGDNTTSKEILQKIANSNATLAPLAKKLLEFSSVIDVPVLLRDISETNPGVSGFYHSGKDQITIGTNRFKFSSEATILHEIIHAYTHKFIDEKFDHPYVQDLERVLTYLRENQTGIRDKYGLTNTHELMTAFFTNPLFIRDLQSIPPSNKIGLYKNAWDEIMHWISKIFKLNSKSAYNELFSMMTSIINEAVEYRQAETSDTYFDFDGAEPSFEKYDTYEEQLAQYEQRYNLIPVVKDGIKGYKLTLAGAKSFAKQFKKSGHLYNLLAPRYNMTSGVLEIRKKQEDVILAERFETEAEKQARVKGFKISQVDEQITTLEKLLLTLAPIQQETVEKIITNLKDYKKALSLDEHTVSVSKLMGGGQIPNASLYKDFTEFGTFMHKVIETIQDEATSSGKSLIGLLTKERFFDILSAYQDNIEKYNANPNNLEKKSLQINNLIENGVIHDNLFEMAQELLSSVQSYVSRGYTIIPETYIFGKSSTGTNVISRIDMMAMDKNGNVEVIDFKTKKLSNYSSVDTQLSKTFAPTPSTETVSAFISDYKNTFDGWDLQLGIYQNLLIQAGVNVTKKTIIALLYKGNKIANAVEEFDLNGLSLWTFDSHELITYESSEDNQPSTNEIIRFKKNQIKVNSVIPIGAAKEAEAQTGNNDFIFNLTKPEEEELIKRLTEINAAELSKTLATIAKLKKENATEEELKYWVDRRETLRKIDDSLNNKDNWSSPYKIGIAIQWLEENIKALLLEEKKVSAIVDVDARIARLNELRDTADGFSYFTDYLKEILISSNVAENDKAIVVLNNISNNVQQIKIAYNELGIQALIQTLKFDLTGRQLVKFTEQQKQAKLPIIASKKKKLAELRASGGTATLKYSIFSKIGNVVNSALKVEGNLTNQIDQLELEIKRLEFQLDGVDMSVDEIRSFLTSVLNSNSISYIGQTATATTQAMASASSSDRVLSGFANFLKQAVFEGQQNFVNYVEKEKIGQEFELYANGRSGSEISRSLSEVRSVLSYDKNDEEVSEDVRGFINPISEAYYNVFKKHYKAVRDLNKKIKADPTNLELKTERTQLLKTHKTWRIENTHMPYVDEIYELDKMLPEDYKQARDILYEDKRVLEDSAGYNNADALDQETLDGIAEIEIELSKLRMAVIKENGAYQEYLDKMDQYYEYDTNYNFFNRMKNAKELELTNSRGELDENRMNAWLAYNTNKVPNQKWYDDVSALYEEIFEILGSNPEVQALNEKRKEILNQYKRKGYIDTRYLTPAEIETLDQLDEVISEAKKSTTKLSYDDRKKLQVVYEKLNLIQTKELNPFYSEDFKSRYEAVEQKYQKLKQAEASGTQDEINTALYQFMLEEDGFAVWYDNNHTNTYQSRVENGTPINPLPKKFNFINIPTQDSMFDLKPTQKYNIKKIKDVGLNKNYQEDELGFPMPKGLTKTQGTRVEGSSPHLNPAYVDLKNRPADFKYYDSFVGRFQKMQVESTGKNLGFAFPGYEESSVEDLKNKGFIKGVKNQLEISKEKNLKVDGLYDYSINDYHSSEEKVRFKFNRPLPIKQQTTDGISAVIMWMEEALVNQSVAAVQPKAKAMLSALEDISDKLSRSALGDKDIRAVGLRRVIDNAKFEYNKHIKGESKLNEGAAGKAVDLVLKVIGFTRLGGDVSNQIGNMLSGNVQAFLGSHKTSEYAPKNLLYAKGKFYGKNGLVGSFLKDASKISGKTFGTKMFYYMNPIQEMNGQNYDKTRSTTQRMQQGLLDGNPLFWIQDKGEIEIAATIWYAILDATKVKVIESVDANGKPVYKKDADGNDVTINAYDAYKENADGEIVIREDVEWSKEEEFALMKSVWSEIRRTQGNYAGADKTAIEAGFKGRLLVYYRKYLLPLVNNRFGRLQDNKEAANMTMGIYNAFFAAWKYYGIKNVMLSIFGKKNDVSDFYSRKSAAAVREAAVAGLLTIIGTLLAQLVKDMDDDDEENSAGKIIMYNLLAVYLKVENETRSLVPVPGMGGFDSYITNLGSFTNVSRDFLKVGKLLTHGSALIGAQFGDSEFLDKHAYYQRKSGQFEEGEAKIKKEIMELSGYMNIYELFNPKSRAEDAFKRR